MFCWSLPSLKVKFNHHYINIEWRYHFFMNFLEKMISSLVDITKWNLPGSLSFMASQTGVCFGCGQGWWALTGHWIIQGTGKWQGRPLRLADTLKTANLKGMKNYRLLYKTILFLCTFLKLRICLIFYSIFICTFSFVLLCLTFISDTKMFIIPCCCSTWKHNSHKFVAFI